MDNHSPVEFRMLGAVEAYQAERRVELGTPRMQRLLVALLDAKGQPVSRALLIEWIWDGVVKNPDQDLSELMGNLRTRLASVGLGDALVCRNKACHLKISPEQVDVHRFDQLVEQARGANDKRAAELLGKALSLVRGEPLGALSGARIENYRTHLRTKCSNARIKQATVLLRIGKAAEAIPALTKLRSAEPHQEKVVELLMLAHYRSGDQTAALTRFREFRADLAESGGMEVSDALSDLNNRIIQRDPELDVVSEIEEQVGDDMPAGDDAERSSRSFTTGDKLASGTESIATEYAVLGTPGSPGGMPFTPKALRDADRVVTGKKTASGQRAIATEYAIDQRPPR